MYILNTLNTIKKQQSNNLKALYSRIIIEKLDLLKKTAIIQQNIKRKRFVIACN